MIRDHYCVLTIMRHRSSTATTPTFVNDKWCQHKKISIFFRLHTSTTHCTRTLKLETNEYDRIIIDRKRFLALNIVVYLSKKNNHD